MARPINQTLCQMVRDCVSLKGGRLCKSVSIFVTALFVTGSATPVWADECRLAVLGDSLTAGYGVEESEAFPAQLQDRLVDEGIACEVINAGVSGDTSAGGSARIGWVLADQPTHVLVELGGNDALRALPVEQLHDNLRRIIDQALGADIEVMLAGMLAPPNLGPRYGQAFARVYQELAAEYGLDFYPFFLDGVAGVPALLIEDGIHPNAQGVAHIVNEIFPFVETFLAQ